MEGGAESRTGGVEGPWLHKRGFGSAEARVVPRRTPEGILYSVGDSLPLFASWAGGGDSHRYPESKPSKREDYQSEEYGDVSDGTQY